MTNTFREVKPYFLAADAAALERGEFHLRVPKHFYVSPFSDVDVAFDFRLRCPGSRMAVQIDDYTGRERMLTSTLTGRRRDEVTCLAGGLIPRSARRHDIGDEASTTPSSGSRSPSSIATAA